jgi:hypothetical protein
MYRAFYRFDDQPAEEIGAYPSADEAAEAARREYPSRTGQASVDDLKAGIYVGPGWVWIEEVTR